VFLAFLPHPKVEVPPVPAVAVNQVAVEISPLLAKGDQVFRVELELGSKMKRLYVVDLQFQGGPAPPAFGLLIQMLMLYCVPVRTSQVCGFAVKDVVNQL
jgi:hypothetical protein